MAIRRRLGWWGRALVVGLLFSGACADEPNVVTPFGEETETSGPPTDLTTGASADDTGGDSTGDDDADGTGDGTGGQGGQGDPCESSEDCMHLCWDPDGDGNGECVEPCGPDCPEGTACADVDIDGMTAEVCVPVPQTFCEPCRTSTDCGGPNDLCVALGGGQFCTTACGDDPRGCPPGFSCGLIGAVGDGQVLMQCIPDNGICCIDGDGDIYGEGSGCYDVDCDDTNAAVHTQADEVCDGFDNDCNGSVDDDVNDCAAADCSLGALGYFETPAESCVDGQCVGEDAFLCDLYTCSDGDEAGDSCATSCDGEDETKCVPTAHCDADVCLPDEPDGGACDEDSDCESAHCQNGFCCDSGDCCSVAEDCPTFGTQNPICTGIDMCQGTVGETVCNGNFICSNTGVSEDDSACDPATQANDCGPYPAVFCTGDVDQVPPTCATDCDSDADCDAAAHCNATTSACEPDVPDGQVCEADSWCTSDHCQNGFCCQSGDCCVTGADCPASYSTDPVCTSQATCQGERDIAVCNANSCATATGVADDSACTSGVVASTCGPYPSVTCMGGSVQNPPECADGCTADIECDTSAYCSAGGVCVPDEPNGGTCVADNQCTSGHCQNGHCCASGDCCATNGDCDAYDEPSECTSESTCQGQRVDGVCSASNECTANTVQDDSGCATIVADDCGPYPSVVCGAGQNQSTPTCPGSCTGDADCDASAHCSAGVCVPDAGQGGFCTTTSECGGGLSCVDNVCCSSACTSTCMACDVPGSVGTCTLIPNGSDPDNECGAISCNDYFNGWAGDNCYDKADVSAASASCNGAGACQSAASRCPSQGQGSVVETCNATCQNPAAGTCTGQTDPVCNNVNPGTNTCGQGVCQNTMNQCQNGAPLTCQPNNAAMGAETCNNLDDNCDGTIDNSSAFSDDFEPNGSCNAYASLGSVGSNATVTYSTQTIYGFGDNDYYRFSINETDSSCQCCDTFCLDEDYRAWIDLTVPPGAGSYVICTATSCGNVNDNCFEVLAGQTGGWIWTFDGGCPGGDSYTMYVRIYGDNSPAYECSPYTLSYHMAPGCY